MARNITTQRRRRKKNEKRASRSATTRHTAPMPAFSKARAANRANLEKSSHPGRPIGSVAVKSDFKHPTFERRRVLYPGEDDRLPERITSPLTGPSRRSLKRARETTGPRFASDFVRHLHAIIACLWGWLTDTITPRGVIVMEIANRFHIVAGTLRNLLTRSKRGQLTKKPRIFTLSAARRREFLIEWVHERMRRSGGRETARSLGAAMKTELKFGSSATAGRILKRFYRKTAMKILPLLTLEHVDRRLKWAESLVAGKNPPLDGIDGVDMERVRDPTKEVLVHVDEKLFCDRKKVTCGYARERSLRRFARRARHSL